MFKMPTTVTALFVAGMGLALTINLAACSQGGTFRSTSQGGTGGSTTISQGGTGGSAPICTVYPSCNPGDQQVTSGPELDYSADCPPERECYSFSAFDELGNNCGSILCVLPEGVHCDDSLSCSPGDARIMPEDCVRYPNLCYTKQLCTQSIYCESSVSPYPYGGLCSSTWPDAGIPEPPDASADGGDAGRKPCCGDGIIDTEYGEQCDMGSLNGFCLDSQGNSVHFGCGSGIISACPCPADTQELCTVYCQFPLPWM